MPDDKQDIQTPPEDDGRDDKVRTGTGKRIVFTIFMLLVLGGLCAAAWLFVLKPTADRKAMIQKHEDFLVDYTRIKSTGYDDFWKCVFPLAAETQISSNLEFETLIKNALSQNAEGFGKHIGGCIPKLQDHIKGVKDLKALPQYEKDVAQLPGVLDGVYNAWKSFSDDTSKAGERARWDKRLSETADKGWGQLYVDYEKRKKSTDDTLRMARRYMKFVTCAVGKSYLEMGKTSTEVEESLVKLVLEGVCSTPEKAMERTKFIEDECVKHLTSPEPPAADDDWEHVFKNGLYYETRSIAVIAGSWEGQDGCIRASEKAKENLMIENLFNAWKAYKEVASGIQKTYLAETKKLGKK